MNPKVTTLVKSGCEIWVLSAYISQYGNVIKNSVTSVIVLDAYLLQVECIRKEL